MHDRLIAGLFEGLTLGGIFWWGGYRAHQMVNAEAKEAVRAPFLVRLFACSFRSDHIVSLWGLLIQLEGIFVFLIFFTRAMGPFLGLASDIWFTLFMLPVIPTALVSIWQEDVKKRKRARAGFAQAIIPNTSTLNALHYHPGPPDQELNGSNITARLGMEKRPPAVAFVAMEYWGGILNRSFLILAVDGMLCGAKVRGISAAPLTARGIKRWLELGFYLTPRFLATYRGVDPTSARFRSLNWMNFQIPCREISRVDLDVIPKWGMGTVIHTGKLYIKTRNGREREFIILGNQNGFVLQAQLRDWLRSCG